MNCSPGCNPMHGSGELPHEVMSAVCERIPCRPSVAVTAALFRAVFTDGGVN